MAEFAYKATTPEGKIVEGLLEAEGERAVLFKLQTLGYVPLRVTSSAAGRRLLSIQSLFPARRKTPKVKDLLIFTQELHTLLRAGLPLDRSLMILEDLSEKEMFREIIHDVIKKIKGGKSLSDAMADYPAVFPKVYVNMIKAGEMGGVVPQVLQEIIAFLERTTELRAFLISSLIYPIILSVMMTVAILVMILFVIPRFSEMFQTSGMPTPLPMAILMNISSFFTSWWWVMAGILAVSVLSIRRWKRSEQGGQVWDQKVLRFPVLGKLINRIEVARFARTLGTLLQNAVPLIASLTLVREVINNRVIAASIEPIKNGVKKGEGLVAPMRKAGVFPALTLHLLEVGEETGNLPAMMMQVADVYESDVRIEIKRLINVLEPLIIIFMGVVVGLIVISMIYSIFSISEIPM